MMIIQMHRSVRIGQAFRQTADPFRCRVSTTIRRWTR
jgi:hypothetical protein